MNTVHQRWMVSALGLLLLAGLCACIASGPGYDGGVGIAYVGGYYEPSGRDYGNWGPGYHVAPPRGQVPPAYRPAPQSSHRAYRPAPPTRPIPSIPNHPRWP